MTSSEDRSPSAWFAVGGRVSPSSRCWLAGNGEHCRGTLRGHFIGNDETACQIRRPICCHRERLARGEGPALDIFGHAARMPDDLTILADIEHGGARTDSDGHGVVRVVGPGQGHLNGLPKRVARCVRREAVRNARVRRWRFGPRSRCWRGLVNGCRWLASGYTESRYWSPDHFIGHNEVSRARCRPVRCQGERLTRMEDALFDVLWPEGERQTT